MHGSPWSNGPRIGHNKQLCTHEIIALSVPVVERLGILGELRKAAGPQGPTDIWTRYGWIRPGFGGDLFAEGINVRRSVLDPLVRSVALATEGVDYRAGPRVFAVHRDPGGRLIGVRVQRGGQVADIFARVVIGGDGASSAVATLAGWKPERCRTTGSGMRRIARACRATKTTTESLARGSGCSIPTSPTTFRPMGVSRWVCSAPMRTEERIAAFKADLDGEVVSMMSSLPDGPDLSSAHRVGTWRGVVTSENSRRQVSSPGLAFVGDAAQVTDFVWGTGCGFAAAGAQWLADGLGPVLAEGKSDRAVDAALRSYRRPPRHEFGMHHRLIAGFSTGRTFNPIEKLVFRGGAWSDRVAQAVSTMGARTVSPLRAITPPILARAALARRVRPSPIGV